MSDILKMKKLQDGCPVMVAKIPEQILAEIDLWVEESRGIKDHPLAELKAHENVGYLSSKDGKKHNSYQTSISPHLIDQSFWLAWVLRLTAKYWGMGFYNRYFSLRRWDGHFDGYDIWTNFSYKGDDNPSHNHAGMLSGVIYYKNHGHPTIFDEYNVAYEGLDGTMIMFPSTTWHHVEKQVVDTERITLAFNIKKDEVLKHGDT
jgi:hypothetical protein|tara:strand:- start:880 stop:1491 length:612 start_codon:yes stop_codon:yes gene_type:complete